MLLNLHTHQKQLDVMNRLHPGSEIAYHSRLIAGMGIVFVELGVEDPGQHSCTALTQKLDPGVRGGTQAGKKKRGARKIASNHKCIGCSRLDKASDYSARIRRKIPERKTLLL